MKVYALSVVLVPPGKSSTTLSTATDLSSFSFYQRPSVGEFMQFFTKTIAERTPQGQRQSVQENQYTAHVWNRGGAEQLAGVIVTDQEYLSDLRSPSSQAPRRLHGKVPVSSYGTPTAISFPEITLQQELDETKIILGAPAPAPRTPSLNSVLWCTEEGNPKRRKTLTGLSDQAQDIESSKAFYKTAKKQNSCCVVM
ncbi:Longin-like domain-containing protein [Fomitopsis serialis]|uniref:Longin-like domain-containing protein n=1 Tax=Fomitopsis serialis TaxID=139415 RepID=UPI0020089B21|nr:Longin-like domain-containing protein [Neoantrodia serialis]KAH9914418.1 Longin-like domain-containing protein [Neoantrodia serialis]